MLKVLLLLAVAASLASVDSTPASREPPKDGHGHEGRGAGPLRDGRPQWTSNSREGRRLRRRTSDTLIFPTKEVEDYLNSMRGNHRGDAIIFPGDSDRKPVYNTDFGYGPEDGPHTWARNFPTCGGTRQSPINVNLDKAGVPPAGVDPALFFKYYDEPPSQLTLRNTGHSLRLTGNWSVGRRPRVSGFILPGEYSLSEVHFHWGANEEEGSEHLVQGYSYPLEMHLVHYKTAYSSFTEAVKKPDGLAVISYLFEVKRHINPGLQKLLIATKEDSKDPSTPDLSIAPFALDKLAPPFTRNYASYLGSLTTPPCSEIVNWIINLEPQSVSSEQLEKFRELKRTDGTKMLFNFRPVQSLNNRDILKVP